MHGHASVDRRQRRRRFQSADANFGVQRRRARQELADRPNAISGVPIVRPDTLERQPTSLTADEGAGCLTIMGWMVDKLRDPAAAA
jgi:hypothetical protein